MKNFNSLVSLSAFGAGLSGLLYAYFFIIAQNVLLSSIFLALSGVFALKVFVGLYMYLKEVDQGYAILMAILGFLGAAGTLLHGGYDLANALNPAATQLTLNPADPRGLLAFGVTGLAILKASWLMSKTSRFPQNLSLLGFLSGILLIVVYLGRLIVLDPGQPILKYPILIEGFLVNPIWYIWLGAVLRKKS
jgi:hypothetical protein